MTANVTKSEIVAVATVTVGPANDEVAQIWAEVQRMVIRMAGGDPSKIDKQLDVDGVMQHLERVQAADQKAAEKHGTVKKVFNRTLQCISRVGGIIADGASNVFGPANTCFNALTFVIGAWQSYSAAFESLAALFEKCAQFLERLPYYREMDAALKKVACLQLKLFVDVCDKALQLRRKRRKFEMFLRHMFLEDDDIKDLLAQMENLTTREHGLVSAQTFKISQDGAHASQEAARASKESVVKLDTLMDYSVAQKQEKVKQQFKTNVQEVFFGKVSKEPGEREATLRKYKAELIDGTGEWLMKEPIFHSWMNGDDSTDPILGIEGGEGSGKTRIATHIIDRLQRQRAVGRSDTRSAVAYYFLEADAKEDGKTAFKKNRVAQQVSRSLLWQLAEAEQPFLKSISGICDKVKLESAADFWEKLLIDNEDRANIESTFFIVLDGLGDNIEGLATLFQKLSENARKLRTRVLVTGSESTFEKLENGSGIRIKKMTLGLRNSQDLELYIRARMDDMEILKDTSRPGVTDTRKMVLEKLTSSTECDYYITSTALNNIERVDSLEEVEECLARAGGARSSQMLEDIKRLNMILKPKEIEEVNEIILWVKWGIFSITPLQVEAALEFQKADPDSRSRHTSLRSLRSKITTKYSSLFRLENETIRFRVDEARESIPEHGSADPILPQELNIVQHYLSTVCPKDVYDKFGFKDFFEQKLERKKNYIHDDPKNACLILALRCMFCLVEEQTDKTKPLRPYAATWIYDYLSDIDLSPADRDLKAQAGPLLVRLFTEESALEALLLPDYGVDYEVESAINIGALPRSWSSWVFSDQGMEVFQKWSQDSTVLELIEDKDAIKNLSHNQGNNEHWYKKAAKLTAKKLLDPEASRPRLQDAFTLLAGLVTRIRQPEEEKSKPFEYDEQLLWSPTLEIFNDVENWIKTEFSPAEDDPVWESQMTKIMFYLPEGIPYSEVEARARKALRLNPDDWITSYNLARSLGSGREVESMRILEDVIEKLKDQTEWRSSKYHIRMYAALIDELGDFHWGMSEDSSMEKAAQAYLMALDEAQTWIDNYGTIIVDRLGDRRQWAHIIAYCEKLLTYYDGSFTLAGKVVYNATMEMGQQFWSVLQIACRETNRWDLLTKLWKEGVKKSTNKSDGPRRLSSATLNSWYAMCLTRRPGYENIGLSMVEELLKENSAKDQNVVTQDELTTFLMPTYTKRALAEGTSPEERKITLEKIAELHAAFEANPYRSQVATLQFARFFHLRGELLTSKKLMRNIVSQMLEMLSDDDLENDFDSFWTLTHVFASVNDEVNMVACFEMMAVSRIAEMAEYERKLDAWQKATAQKEETPTEQKDSARQSDSTIGIRNAESQEGPSGDSQAPTAKQEEPPRDNETGDSNAVEEDAIDSLQKPEKPDKDIVGCFGDCGVGMEFPGGIWVCLDCVGTTLLDESCHAKASEKGVKEVTCSADHSFYQLPACDEASIRAIPHGSIRVSGKFVTLESWKADIKANYADCGKAVVQEDAVEVS